jgi:ATP-dependent Clp protease ATP-binding subunit ClpC
MDDIISFRPLTRDTLSDILDIEIEKLVSRMKEQNRRLVVSPEAKAQLLEKAYDPQYGARPIRRAVQTYLEDEITRRLLDNPDKRTLTISKLNVESAPSK